MAALHCLLRTLSKAINRKGRHSQHQHRDNALSEKPHHHQPRRPRDTSQEREMDRGHRHPISSTSFFNDSLSIEARGSERNRLILRSRIVKASRNARSSSCGEPCTAAGSGTPQCAVIGWPGQMGHTSFAALSHTVKTKSSFGAPGLENSSQLLLRKLWVGIRAESSRCSASARTVPEGWLPAL